MDYQIVNERDIERPVDVLVLTAVEVERDAVLKVMTSFAGSGPPVKTFLGQAVYYAGCIGQYRCVLLMCRAGSTGRDGSALATQDALSAWKPRAGVVMPGIAFGRYRPGRSVRSAPRQVIGDILVATQLFPYESERRGAEKNVDRGPRPESSLILENRLRNLHWRWVREGDNTPRGLQFGPMLSGEKLVDDKAFRDKLFERFPEAIGGEMEGAGVYAAASRARVDWMIFKSICDWADGTKNKKHHGFAAQQAAELLLRLLSEDGLVATHQSANVVQDLSPIFASIRSAHQTMQQKSESIAKLVSSHMRDGRPVIPKPLQPFYESEIAARDVAVEQWLNAYNDACSAALDGRAAFPQLASTLGTEIAQLIEHEGPQRARLHPRDASDYHAIWRAYDRLHPSAPPNAATPPAAPAGSPAPPDVEASELITRRTPHVRATGAMNMRGPERCSGRLQVLNAGEQTFDVLGIDVHLTGPNGVKAQLPFPESGHQLPIAVPPHQEKLLRLEFPWKYAAAVLPPGVQPHGNRWHEVECQLVLHCRGVSGVEVSAKAVVRLG